AERGRDAGERQPPLNATAGQLVDGEPCGGNQRPLDTAVATDEVNRRWIVTPFDQGAHHGQPGQQVARGAPARDDRPRAAASLRAHRRAGEGAGRRATTGRPVRRAAGCRAGALTTLPFFATFSSTPHAAMPANNDDPPKEMN